MSLEFKDIQPTEKERTYHFADGKTISFKEVTRLCVRPSGSHRLETKDGKKHIVAAGWLAITIDTDVWSF